LSTRIPVSLQLASHSLAQASSYRIHRLCRPVDREKRTKWIQIKSKDKNTKVSTTYDCTFVAMMTFSVIGVFL